jgi:hypothetical protein
MTMSLRSYSFGNLAGGVQGHGVNDHARAGHHVLGQVLLAAAGEVDIPYPDRGRRNQEDSD